MEKRLFEELTYGEFNLISELDDNQMKMYFRVTKEQFQELHNHPSV